MAGPGDACRSPGPAPRRYWRYGSLSCSGGHEARTHRQRALVRGRGGRPAPRRSGAGAGGELRRRRRHPVPAAPGGQSLEHAGRHPAARPGLGRLHRAHEPRDRAAPRLRDRLGGGAYRYPVRGGPRHAAQGPHPLHRLRERERPRAVPGPTRRAGRGRRRALRGRRPPRAGARRGQQGPVRALPCLQAGGRLLERAFGSRLRPHVQRAAAGRLDVGRRRRSADPAGTRAVRRDRGRGRARPRAALHRLPERSAPTSTRPRTSRATPPTPTSRRWAYACGCARTSM